jgi:hypothetical protein
MQKLTLQDFEFGIDHNYCYGDYSLMPTFGGFYIFYRDKQVIKHPVGEAAALFMISEHIKGMEILTQDDMRFDYEMEKLYQLNQEG